MAVVVRAIMDGVEMREAYKTDDEDAEQRGKRKLQDTRLLANRYAERG